MKTSLVTALLAVAIAVAVGGCSSDNSSTLVTNSAGTVAQGGACSDSTDCEAPLSCGFAINNDAGSCKSTGICVAFGPISVLQACSCASTPALITVNVGTDYASQPINSGVTCAATTGDGGTTTTTTPDSGSGTTKTDSGSGTTTVDSGSGTVKDAATGG
jgi:hypothetical protein